MKEQSKRKQQAKHLRGFRKVHRSTGALLFIFFFVVSISGLTLGWKKHSAGLILPDTQEGTSNKVNEWLPLDSLSFLASAYLDQHTDGTLSTEIDRIDVRQSKGVLKYTFKGHHQEVQVDGATGEVLASGIRYSDFVEAIHDGSYIDELLGTNGWFKLFYTSVMGIALLVFTITGFWLWYGPKRMRANQ
jgi:uncharacterized iron-regulated membrane protein